MRADQRTVHVGRGHQLDPPQRRAPLQGGHLGQRGAAGRQGGPGTVSRHRPQRREQPGSRVVDRQPPSPITTRRALSATAAAISVPTPYDVVIFGSRSVSASRCSPPACALSTYAVSPTRSTCPVTGRPSGSAVATDIRSPPRAAASTARKPGPPSESGRRHSSSAGAIDRHPAATASAAATAEMVPANLSGQMSTRMGQESASSQLSGAPIRPASCDDVGHECHLG